MSLFTLYTIFVTIAFVAYIGTMVSKEVIAVKRSLVKPEDGETFEVEAITEPSVEVREIAGGFSLGGKKTETPNEAPKATQPAPQPVVAPATAPAENVEEEDEDAEDVEGDQIAQEIIETAEGLTETRTYTEYEVVCDAEEMLSIMHNQNLDGPIAVRRENHSPVDTTEEKSNETPDRI